MPHRRLFHTHSAYLRSMQMSSASLFAFVEGKDIDRFFYGHICYNVCNPQGLIYETCKADELPPFAGGKSTLLEFYNYLRLRHCLVSHFGGKKTTAVFFLDKDIDDLKHIRKRSKHVIYTRYYDVQNEVFHNGNLKRGAASAASLDERVLDPLNISSNNWCSHASRRWHDWLVLCIISSLNGIRCQYNFGSLSQIQCPTTRLSEPTRLDQAKMTLATLLGLNAIDFQILYDIISLRVKRYFRSGQHNIIFKGKWYPYLLEEDIINLVGRNNYTHNGFSNRVSSSVASTLDFEQAWVDYYTTRLQAAIIKN